MSVLKRPPKLIAVIHHEDAAISTRNAEIARDAGYEGVALINMRGLDATIDRPAHTIKNAMPSMLVIANRLTTPAQYVVDRDVELGLDGSWVDNPGVYSHRRFEEQTYRYAEGVDRARKVNPDFLFFASVAFKTQDVDPNPQEAASIAAGLKWIPTTSGTATGIAPQIEKLRDMKNALLPKQELAVASGVSPENGSRIALYVDWIFVATGISKSFLEFDEEKARLLREATNFPQ